MRPVITNDGEVSKFHIKYPLVLTSERALTSLQMPLIHDAADQQKKVTGLEQLMSALSTLDRIKPLVSTIKVPLPVHCTHVISQPTYIQAPMTYPPVILHFKLKAEEQSLKCAKMDTEAPASIHQIDYDEWMGDGGGKMPSI